MIFFFQDYHATVGCCNSSAIVLNQFERMRFCGNGELTDNRFLRLGCLVTILDKENERKRYGCREKHEIAQFQKKLS